MVARYVSVGHGLMPTAAPPGRISCLYGNMRRLRFTAGATIAARVMASVGAVIPFGRRLAAR